MMDNVISEQKPKGSEGGNQVVNLKEKSSQEEETLNAKRLKQDLAQLEERQGIQSGWNREKEGSGRRT